MHIACLPSADLSYDSGSVLFSKLLINQLAHFSDVTVLASTKPAKFPSVKNVSISVKPRLLEHPIVTDRIVSDLELNTSYKYCLDFLLKLNNRRQIDLIYVQYLSFSSAAAVHFAKERAIPVIVSSFGRDLEVGIPNDPRLHKFALQTISCANLFHVPAIHIAKRLKHLGSSIGITPKVKILPPPIDYEFFNAGKTRSNIFGKTKLRILTINSCFKPDKGIQDIIEAVKIVRDDYHINCELYIAGSDDHPELHNEHQLKEIVRQLNLEKKVYFLGYLNRESVRRALERSTIFVDARLTSGHSSVLVEALATGAAIICSKNSASVSLLKKSRAALTFPPKNIKLLAKCIHSLLSNQTFRSELQSRAQNHYRSIEGKYSPEYSLLSLANEIRRLVK